MGLLRRAAVLLVAATIAACSSAPAATPVPTLPNLASAAPSASAQPAPSGAPASSAAPAPSSGPTSAATPGATAAPTSAGASSSAGPAPSEEPLPPIGTTAWEQELDNRAPDGTRSLDSALRLFAIAFGPIPGVEAPNDVRLVEDATIALRAIRAHAKELTPEQQAAIAQKIAPKEGSFHITVERTTAWIAGSFAALPGVAGAVNTEVPPPEVQERLVREAHDIRAFYAGKLGDMPGLLEIYLSGETPVDDKPGLTLGFADPTYDDKGNFKGCSLVVNGNATNRGDAAAIRVMSHEIFHCFQASIVPGANWDGMPDWIIEGSAEWAADQIHPLPVKNARWWSAYLTQPMTPLFNRSYDAVGFFGHLAETGIDPWTVLKAMYTSGIDSATVFKVSGADNDAFMNSWASGLTRQAQRGRAWNTDEASISADAVIAPPLTIGDGGTYFENVAPYANWVETLTVTSKFLQVASTGHVRMHDGSQDLVLGGGGFYCTDDAACEEKCPDGTDISPKPSKLGTTTLVATTGGTQGSTVNATGLTLEEVCKRQMAVWVHIDRPASPGLDAGRVLEIVSCTGPLGSWKGVMRLGGIDGGGGFHVAFVELPMAFTVDPAGNARTVVAGNVPTPVFDVDVRYDLSIAVDPKAKKMSITGTGSGDNGMFAISDALGPGLSNLAIEPAPKGRCP